MLDSSYERDRHKTDSIFGEKGEDTHFLGTCISIPAVEGWKFIPDHLGVPQLLEDLVVLVAPIVRGTKQGWKVDFQNGFV